MANIAVTVSGNEGWLSIQSNIKKTTEVAKQLYGGVGALGTQFKSITGDLGKLSGLSAISFAGLIATAPRLAGNLAQIELAAFKITDAIAQAAKPAVDFFTDSMTSLANFVTNNSWAAQAAAGFMTIATVVGAGSVLYTGLNWFYQTWVGIASAGAQTLKFAVSGIAAAATALDTFAVSTFGAASFTDLVAGVTIPIALAFGVPNALNAVLPSQNPGYENNVKNTAASFPVIGNQLGPISDLFQGGSVGLGKLVEPGGALSNAVNGAYSTLDQYGGTGLLGLPSGRDTSGALQLVIQVLDNAGNTLQTTYASHGTTSG